MKNALLLLACFFCFTFSVAQNENLDSLLKVTEALDDNDTNKIYNYCDLAIQFNKLSEFDKSLKFISKAELIVEKCRNKRILGIFYFVAGQVNYSNQNYKESLSYLLKAVKLFEELGNKHRLAACYTVLGLIYQDQTFYDKAQGYFVKSLNIRIELKDSVKMAGAYSNLGLNFYKISHHKKTSHTDCYETQEAIKNLNTAYSIAKRQNLSTIEASALGNLSNIMNDKKEFREALKYATRALYIYRNTENTYEEAITLIDLGAIYLAQKKYKESVAYFENSLEISVKNNFDELKRYNYINLADVNKKMEDYKKAFLYQEKLISINDSVFNKENLKQINEMQIKYESEKKESENALLLVKNELSDKAIKNQKTVILLIIIGLALSLVFAFFIFRGLSKQKKANKIISQQKKEVEIKNELINQQHELLEEKQKEILDSIKYAKRIQSAHLPTDKYVAKNLERLKDKK
jgi:tetratricopeptide (TPR) repeat protein